MRTFLAIWIPGAIVTLAANLYSVRKELRAWWPDGPTGARVAVCFLFPAIALALWPILLLLIIGAPAILPNVPPTSELDPPTDEEP